MTKTWLIEISQLETEKAYSMARRFAREEGMLVGISAGAAAVVALRIAANLKSDIVVAIFPDSGDKYFSNSFWIEGE